MKWVLRHDALINLENMSSFKIDFDHPEIIRFFDDGEQPYLFRFANANSAKTAFKSITFFLVGEDDKGELLNLDEGYE